MLCVILGSRLTANWRWSVTSARSLRLVSTTSGGCGSSATRSARRPWSSWRRRLYWVVSTIAMSFSPVCPRRPLILFYRVLNAAARLVLRLDRRSHITPALRELHWLPVKFRIQFKLAVFMHQSSTQRCPSYVADLVDFCASDPQRRSLRSASTCAAVIRRMRTELGRRAFTVSGPDVWNSLPPSLRIMTSHSAFRRSLKTYFYKLAFLSWFYWLCNARSVDFLFVRTRTINFRM